MGSLPQLEKIIDHPSDSAGCKASYIIHRWVVIETHNNVMHFPTCNVKFCVFLIVNFIMVLIFVNMEDSISTIYKVLKAKKLPNVILLCDIKFYVSPTLPFWSL